MTEIFVAVRNKSKLQVRGLAQEIKNTLVKLINIPDEFLISGCVLHVLDVFNLVS